RVAPTRIRAGIDRRTSATREDGLRRQDARAAERVSDEIITRGVLTTEADGTETTRHADKRLTGVTAEARAVINVVALFEGEHSREAVAQIFDAAETETRTRQTAAVDC